MMNLERLREILSAHESYLRDCGVKSLKVFGSFARGENHSGSDVDLLVEFDGRSIGLFEFIALKHFLTSILKHKVDLVTSAALKKQLKNQIEKEAILVA